VQIGRCSSWKGRCGRHIGCKATILKRTFIAVSKDIASKSFELSITCYAWLVLLRGFLVVRLVVYWSTLARQGHPAGALLSSSRGGSGMLLTCCFTPFWLLQYIWEA